MECLGRQTGKGVMNILITGNSGYVGSTLVKHLKTVYPNHKLIGYDMGYFKNCLTNTDEYPEKLVDQQYFGDVRKISSSIFEGIDVVINLAAISNDPMGKKYSDITRDVNFNSSVKIAKLAKESNVKSFVFASSCSIYGNGTNNSRTEQSEINPLTEYAKSKVETENEIEKLADNNFCVTSLRFATACGMSDRLRLDLVLNDFVASAIINKKIQILSDGTPWRPLIHVKDMSRALEWASFRNGSESGNYLKVNVGSNEWNYNIKDLALAVKSRFTDVDVEINENAPPDKRSYKVNFDKYNNLAPDHAPKYSLERTIDDIKDGLIGMKFCDDNFRNSDLIRLQKLTNLQKNNRLDDNLEWIN